MLIFITYFTMNGLFFFAVTHNTPDPNITEQWKFLLFQPLYLTSYFKYLNILMFFKTPVTV